MADSSAPVNVVNFATRRGTITALADDHPIATALARYGEWAEIELETLLDLIQPGDVVLDVGAHVGIFTLAFARKVGCTGRVISFEPQPLLHELLRQNVSQNEVADRVDTQNCAVGAAAGYVRLPPINYCQPGNFGAVLPEPYAGPLLENGNIAMLKIDDLDLRRCRLIKIDVEGTESQVIEGADKTIRRLRPLISVEALTIEAAWTNVRALRALGLKTFLLATPAFNPMNWRSDPEDFFDLAYECAIVGAPEEDEQKVQDAARLGALLTPVSSIDDLARAFVEIPLPGDTEFERASARQNLRRMHREKAELLHSIRSAQEALHAALSSRKVVEADLQTSRAETQKARVEIECAQENLRRANQEHDLIVSALNDARAASVRFETERESARVELRCRREELSKLGDALQQQNTKAAAAEVRSQRRLETAQDLAFAAEKIGNRPVWNLRNYIAYRAARLIKQRKLPLSTAWHKKLERTLWKKDPGRFTRALATRETERSESKPQQTEAARLSIAEPSQPTPQQSFERVVDDIAAAGKFDRSWYMARYPDIQQAGVDPLKHYVSDGWREHRDPASWFSTSYYLIANPDVAAAGVNPFWHYIVAGQKEARQITHPGGLAAAMLSRLVPLSEQRRMQESSLGRAETQRLDEDSILRLLKTGASPRRLLVALSHDDYRRISGGIQLCLQIEQKAATTDWSGSFLNLHPRVPLPTLVDADRAESYEVIAVLDGEALGVATAGTICSALEKLAPSIEISVTVHSLLGHATEFVARLYQLVRAREAIFWLHDYFAACTSHTLMRNGIQYCSAPPEESAACQICIHGPERKLHRKRIRTLFETIPFRLVAPSHSAKRFWSAATSHRADNIEVIPHCTFGKEELASSEAARGDAPPARIAFLGYNTYHKGWNVFAQLAKTFGKDSRYQFLHLGSGNEFMANVAFEDVSVAKHGRNAMSQAVAKLDIDVALTWSLKPETFGFVGYEAIAGGAKTIAWDGSGHLADLARIPGHGLVLPSVAALHEAFRDGRICDLAKSRRASGRTTRELVFSRMSIELLAERAASEAVA